MTDSHRERHAAALLAPLSEDERNFSELFGVMSRLADQWKDDRVILPAIEKIGSAIIRLLDGPIGRIDQADMRKMVEDTVSRAGGDLDAL
jgi:hypothetical protein